jgi:hypothetical protein
MEKNTNVHTAPKAVTQPKVENKAEPMKMPNISLPGLSTVISVAVLSVVIFLSVGQIVGVFMANAKYQAVDQCFKAATIQSNDTLVVDEKDITRTLSEPITPYYEKCLKDKGFQPSK